jgi:hypothetical protein
MSVSEQVVGFPVDVAPFVLHFTLDGERTEVEDAVKVEVVVIRLAQFYILAQLVALKGPVRTTASESLPPRLRLSRP